MSNAGRHKGVPYVTGFGGQWPLTKDLSYTKNYKD